MARYYVDADKVIEHIKQYKNSNKKTFQQGINFAIKVVCRALSDNRIVPRADVAEVIHAKWIINSDGYYPYCSNCKEIPECGVMSKYCPECGARMDKE